MIAVVLALALTVPITTKGASDSEARRLGFDPAKIQAMRTRLQSFVAEGRLPGMVVLIQRHGKLVSLDAIGYRAVGATAPMTADIVFQTMSMTKPFTATALCMLVERGLVRLSDPVSRYLPEFGKLRLKDGVAPSGPVRVRHLLNHTSGIASDMPISDEDRAGTTLQQFVELVARQPLVTEPGTAERYSGPAISVAGRIVEVVSGKPFERFLADEIFRPLGMNNSWMFLPAEERARLAGVSVLEDEQLKAETGDPARTGARFANPAGGLYSTAEDLARWHQAMLGGGAPVIGKTMLKLMTTLPTSRPIGAGEEVGFGVGWSVVRAPGPSSSLLPAGTFGHAGAYGSYSWTDPTTGIVGVFLSQRVFGADREIDAFRTMVYAAAK